MPPLSNTHALIVGIANYQYVAPLPATALNDAQAIYDLLIDPQHCAYHATSVALLLDQQATQTALRRALGALAQRTNEESTVFIYISSHGGRIESGLHGGAYLLPVDARYTSAVELVQTALSGTEFTLPLQNIPARKVVVIFDCCHAAGLTKDVAGTLFKRGLPETYYGQLQSGCGRVVLASSRSDEFSWIFPSDQNSLFTKHLLIALRGGIASDDGLIRVFGLVDYVQKQVRDCLKSPLRPRAGAL